MFKGSIGGFLRCVFSNPVYWTGAAALLVSASSVHAANCSISTTPTPAVITAGETLTFSGNVGGKRPATMSWQFPGGSPATAGDVSPVTVTYTSDADSPFTAELNGTDQGLTILSVASELPCQLRHVGHSCKAPGHRKSRYLSNLAPL